MKSVQNLQSLSRVFLSVDPFALYKQLTIQNRKFVLIDIISLSLVCKILQSRVVVQSVLSWIMNHISYRNMFYMLNMHLWLKIRLKYSRKTQKKLKIFKKNSKMAKYLFTAKNGRNMYLNIFYLNKYFGLPWLWFTWASVNDSFCVSISCSQSLSLIHLLLLFLSRL